MYDDEEDEGEEFVWDYHLPDPRRRKWLEEDNPGWEDLIRAYEEDR